MPSDYSANLKTAATAAFCARLLVHPLDNVKVSIQCAKNVPDKLLPQLQQLVNTVRHQVQVQQKRLGQSSSPQQLARAQGQNVSKAQVWRGLYGGVSVALIFQVPAMACFLSTYDATKHGLAFISQNADLPIFQLHHAETHLASGFMAKAVGTLVWAPMNRIQAMQPSSGLMQLTLKDAYQLAKQVCAKEGVSGLWSGYGKTLGSLLPYTMIYFATYEHIKKAVRYGVSKSTDASGESFDSAAFFDALQGFIPLVGDQTRLANNGSVELTPGIFMACVASSVATSSAICQTAIAIREKAQEHLDLALDAPKKIKTPTVVTNSVPTLRLQPMLNSASSSSLSSSVRTSSHPMSRTFPSALTVMGSSSGSGFRAHPMAPPQFKALMSSSSTVAGQVASGLPWQPTQHATVPTSCQSGMMGTSPHHLHTPTQSNLLKPSAAQYLSQPNSPTSPISPLSFGCPSSPVSPNTPVTPASSALSCANSSLAARVTAAPAQNASALMMTSAMTAPITRTAAAAVSGAAEAAATTTIHDIRDLRRLSTSSHYTTMSLSKSAVAQSSSATTPGLFRSIARGLGPRIMWTVPGVTLTTAGFEVLRSMATPSL